MGWENSITGLNGRNGGDSIENLKKDYKQFKEAGSEDLSTEKRRHDGSPMFNATKKEWLNYAKENLNDDSDIFAELQQAGERFDAIDEDGDGKITPYEMTSWLGTKTHKEFLEQEDLEISNKKNYLKDAKGEIE